MKEKDCISIHVGLPYLALVLLFLGLNFFRTSLATAPMKPLWWEISIILRTDGEYTLEGKESDCRGKYSFIIHWKGCLEKDDDDYLLYHVDSRLSDWEAQETISSPQNTETLATREIKKKPSFILKYILRRETNLLLNFLVKGIFVPQSGGEDSFFIFFPSSEENGQRHAQVDYNTCVVEGSNVISLKEAEIYAGPVIKDYAWAWKHEQQQSRQQSFTLTSQSHRTSLALSIIPHYAQSQQNN